MIQNVARFVVALDAYLRLDTMVGQPLSTFGATNGVMSDPTPRSGAGGTWGL